MNKSRLLFIGLGILIGAGLGYLYYFYIGCTSGTCAITSRPINSTLYGSVMGGLFFDLINDWRRKLSQK